MKKVRKLIAVIFAMVMALSVCTMNVSAADSELDEGTYDVTSYVTLSCYINAMGGVEFAADTLEKAILSVDAEGNTTLKMELGYTSGNIYGTSFTAFIDATDVTPGYYDANGDIQNAEYTLSTEKLSGNTLEKDGSSYIYEDRCYVNSMTFPVVEGKETNYLYLYINSNVMGCLFCDGSGEGGSSQTSTLTKYAGSLTINWDGIYSTYAGSTGGSTEGAAKSEEQSSAVTYTYEGSSTGATGAYEVSIPSTIAMGTSTSANYTVSLTSADLDENAYITVSAPKSGTLTSGDESLVFTNTLESQNLTTAGSSLSGSVALASEATQAGDYTGTLTFTISYFSGN